MHGDSNGTDRGLPLPPPPARDRPETASVVFVVLHAVGVAVDDSVGVVGPALVLQDLGQPLALGVGVVPEVEEEEEEDKAVQADDVHEDGELVRAVLHEEILEDVGGDDYELDLRVDGTTRFLTWMVQ